MAKYTRPLKLRDFRRGRPAARSLWTRRMFTEVAPTYACLTRWLSFGQDAAWKKLLVRGLPDLPRPRVLDLACGTGDLTLALARKYPAGRVIGLDLNPAMLARARARGAPGNLRYRLGNMNRTGFPAGSFDLVTGGYALRNSPDLVAALQEVRRVLKPGGRAAFLDFSKSSRPWGQALGLFGLKVWGGLWGLLLHGNPDIYAYISESLKVFPDREALRRLLTGLGFKRLSTRVLFFGFLEIVNFTK